MVEEFCVTPTGDHERGLTTPCVTKRSLLPSPSVSIPEPVTVRFRLPVSLLKKSDAWTVGSSPRAARTWLLLALK
jgi:hypothetical protein